MSLCDDQQDEFIKNEYILNLNELIMTRNYIYKEKTYQKYRITDLSVKKKNSYVRNIYEENGNTRYCCRASIGSGKKGVT